MSCNQNNEEAQASKHVRKKKEGSSQAIGIENVWDVRWGRGRGSDGGYEKKGGVLTTSHFKIN